MSSLPRIKYGVGIQTPSPRRRGIIKNSPAFGRDCFYRKTWIPRIQRGAGPSGVYPIGNRSRNDISIERISDSPCSTHVRENLEEEKKRNDQEVVISEEALKEAEKYIEEEEGPSRRLTGRMDVFITVVAVVMSLVHLYAAIGVIMTQVLRGIHVMLVLFLSFLVFPILQAI